MYLHSNRIDENKGNRAEFSAKREGRVAGENKERRDLKFSNKKAETEAKKALENMCNKDLTLHKHD